jgi:hypothetical protein
MSFAQILDALTSLDTKRRERACHTLLSLTDDEWRDWSDYLFAKTG